MIASGEVEERADDVLAPFVAALQPVEGVVCQAFVPARYSTS